MDFFQATCAATGELLPGEFAEATANQIDAACERAADAALELREFSPERLGEFLSAVASAERKSLHVANSKPATSTLVWKASLIERPGN